MVTAQRLHDLNFNLALYFREDDSQALTYTYTSDTDHSAWLIVNNADQKLQGTCAQGVNQTSTMTITATDVTGLATTSNSFTFQLLEDLPPQETTAVPSSIDCYEGVLCSFNAATYFSDLEGDQYNFLGTTVTPAGSVPTFGTDMVSWFHTTTQLEASSGGYVTINFKVRDAHFTTGDTAETVVNQVIYFKPNRVPLVNSTIPNQSVDAGMAYSYTILDTVFVEEDGEPITLTVSCTPTCSWLTLDNTSKAFSGTPQVNADALNYTVTVTAADNNTNSADSDTSFTLEVVPNRTPEIDQGLVPAPNITVYFPFSYTIPANAFKDFENEQFTIVHEITPADFTTTYDPATRVITGTPADNTKFGDYTLNVYVTDIWAVANVSASVPFKVYENQPPAVVTPPSDPPCIVAHYPLNYSIPKSSFSEPEGETITYSHTSAPVTPWMTLDTTDPTNIKFTGVPNNTQLGNAAITLTLDDGHNDVADSTATFVV